MQALSPSLAKICDEDPVWKVQRNFRPLSLTKVQYHRCDQAITLPIQSEVGV